MHSPGTYIAKQSCTPGSMHIGIHIIFEILKNVGCIGTAEGKGYSGVWGFDILLPIFKEI